MVGMLLSVLIIAIPGILAEYLVARSAQRGFRALGWVPLVLSWISLLVLTFILFNPTNGNWGGLVGAVVWVGSMIDRAAKAQRAKILDRSSAALKTQSPLLAEDSPPEKGRSQND